MPQLHTIMSSVPSSFLAGDAKNPWSNVNRNWKKTACQCHALFRAAALYKRVVLAPVLALFLKSTNGNASHFCKLYSILDRERCALTGMPHATRAS